MSRLWGLGVRLAWRSHYFQSKSTFSQVPITAYHSHVIFILYVQNGSSVRASKSYTLNPKTSGTVKGSGFRDPSF